MQLGTIPQNHRLLLQVEGITLAVMEQALEQAKVGRQHILREMGACNPPPAKQLSQYAPRIRRFTIDPDKIGQVIGSGGRTVKMLQAAAGCDEIQVRRSILFQVPPRRPPFPRALTPPLSASR